MTLKIVAGTAKGRILKGPKDISIRPASAQVRKSVFEILGDLSECKILDLFAGVGGMGIEALSRGAAHVTFVDKARPAIQCIQANLATLKFTHLATLIPSEVCKAIERLHQQNKIFDLIFIDPPYDQGLVQKTLNALEQFPIFHNQTLILSEHSPRENFSIPKIFQLEQTRSYGQTKMSFLAVVKRLITQV